MYVYTKDIVAFHIDTVNTKENMYIKGHIGFILTVYSVCYIYIKCVKKAQNTL